MKSGRIASPVTATLPNATPSNATASNPTASNATTTSRSGDEAIEKLTARISELEEANANLQLLDDAMRRNNALFEALLVNSWQGITLTGPDRRILKVVRGLTGRRAQELRGALVESLAVREDHEVIIEAYRKLLRRACEKITIEVRVPRADGTIAWFSATLTDMLDDPNVQCIVWNYTDISKDKQIESTLVPY